MDLKELRVKADRLEGRLDQIKKLIAQAELRKEEKQVDLENHEEAREVIKEAGLKTQEALAYHISDITTLALQSVFDDPYELQVNFVERRNKTECDIVFKKAENVMDPMDSSGGGAIDVASFALRVASWSMQIPRSRPVIILDEPMKHLSTGLQPKASEMIKQISEKMGIQFIIVTHEKELTEEADKVFRVSQKKGRTKIEEQ